MVAVDRTLAKSGHLDGTESERRRTRRFEPLIPIIFLLLAATATLGASSTVGLATKILLSALGLSAHLMFLYTILFAGKRHFGIFELRLGNWFLAYAVLAFGLSTITILKPQEGSAAVVDKAMVPMALMAVGISFTVWALGYVLGSARILQAPLAWGKKTLMGGLSTEIRGAGALLWTFLLGVSADILLILVGGQYGYLGQSADLSIDAAAWYTQPVMIVSGLKSVALFGFSVRVFMQHSDRFVQFLLPTLLFSLATSLLTGMKEAFIATFICVGIPYLLGKSRHRLAAIIALSLVFIFVVTPVVTGFRHDLNSSSGRLDVISGLAVGVKNIFSSDGYLSDPSGTQSGVNTLERVRLIDNVAVIIDKTPADISYRPIVELIVAPITGLVPRLFWPDKPVRLSGYDFYKSYYSGQGQSSSALTPQGSLYLYGGVGVLMVGMLIIGVATRALDDVLRARNDLHGALFFIVLAAVVVKQEMDVGVFLASIPVFLVSWVLGARLIFRRSIVM